ncbi:MAG: hypothetical protein Q7T89_17470 [Anaerolineales bacterium]|nr:hypothetical protein [Anaerolineales bacterium]
MSKKKKDNKINSNNQKKILQTLPPEEKSRIRIESLFFSITILILVLTVFGKYVNSPNVSLPISILWKTSVAILIGFRAGGNRVILKSLNNHKNYTYHSVPSRFQKAIRVISIVIIAIIVFPAIYYSPLREQLSVFLVSIQAFSKSAADDISTILSAVLASISGYFGNIFLGALGNLFYDVVKSIYNNLRLKRNKPEAKKRK